MYSSKEEFSSSSSSSSSSELMNTGCEVLACSMGFSALVRCSMAVFRCSFRSSDILSTYFAIKLSSRRVGLIDTIFVRHIGQSDLFFFHNSIQYLQKEWEHWRVTAFTNSSEQMAHVSSSSVLSERKFSVCGALDCSLGVADVLSSLLFIGALWTSPLFSTTSTASANLQSCSSETDESSFGISGSSKIRMGFVLSWNLYEYPALPKVIRSPCLRVPLSQPFIRFPFTRVPFELLSVRIQLLSWDFVNVQWSREMDIWAITWELTTALPMENYANYD